MTTPTDNRSGDDVSVEGESQPDNVIPLTPAGPRPDDELCWLSVDRLVPHPDNPRVDLGDLTEMVRSMRTHGVLEPLVVLPAGDDGRHMIVAGHRRHAAARRATLTHVPAVVRSMTASEVLEAALAENVNRSDLLVSEEVRAIERLMSLDSGLTPAKLCRRIGRSQGWVRARMAVTILPARWRSALDSGDLSLAAAEAAASAADLGPEHLDRLCEKLAASRWIEPSHVVSDYRSYLEREAAYAKAVEKQRRRGGTFYTDEDPPPERAKPLSDLFATDAAKAHAGEPCHAVLVRRTSWGDGFRCEDLCTDPRRHSPKQVESGRGSSLATDRRPKVHSEDSHAKRRGRVSRLEHAVALWAKTRGAPSQTQLTGLGLQVLVHEAGRDAVTFAATILGYDKPRDVTPDDLLAEASTPKALARVAGAVACGIAETHMYWSTNSLPCREWLDLLCANGWEPDDWTAAQLARRDARPGHTAGGSSEGARRSGPGEAKDELGDQTEDHIEDELGDEPAGAAGGGSGRKHERSHNEATREDDEGEATVEEGDDGGADAEIINPTADCPADETNQSGEDTADS